MSSVFDAVETLVVPRSFFKMSPSCRTTMNIGKLYPTFVKRMIPGETIDLYQAQLVKVQPMQAPSMTPLTYYCHAFFVPFRLCDDEFEKKYMGFDDKGNPYEGEFPLWNCPENPVGKIWDYLGLPINVGLEDSIWSVKNTNVSGIEPSAYYRIGYNLIYNNWFRNADLIDEVSTDNEELLYRCWRKDYFTSALPFQQKPDVPMAFDVQTHVNQNFPVSAFNASGEAYQNIATPQYSANSTVYSAHNTAFPPASSTGGRTILSGAGNLGYGVLASDVELSNTSFTIAEMRLAFQMQKWAERNARCVGAGRFADFLRAHFGVSPRDERLQIPEFIGGTKAPILISDVVQTSASEKDNPLGNRGALGSSVGGDHLGKYHCVEPGFVICLASILPQSEYMQGVNRQFIIHDRMDFVSPEFCCLSERKIDSGELVVSSSTDNDVARQYNTKLFGYTGMYNEYRYLPNITTGRMRTVFHYWHQTRVFDPTIDNPLNADFVQCHADNRVFMAREEDPFIVNIKTDVKDFLPITYRAEPGLIDHY